MDVCRRKSDHIDRRLYQKVTNDLWFLIKCMVFLIGVTEQCVGKITMWTKDTGALADLPLESNGKHNASSVVRCAQLCSTAGHIFFAYVASSSDEVNCVFLDSLSDLSQKTSVWLKPDEWDIYRRPNMLETVEVIAFRVSADTSVKVYNFYTDGKSSPLSMYPEAYDRTTPLSTPFKSEELLSLTRKGLVRIRIQMWKSRQTVVDVEFDASGSDKYTWFTNENLKESQWADLGSEAGLEYDSFEQRYFMAQKSGGQCVDVGWFTVVDGNDFCGWGKFEKYPKFLYSTDSSGSFFGAEARGLADDFVLVVVLEI